MNLSSPKWETKEQPKLSMHRKKKETAYKTKISEIKPKIVSGEVDCNTFSKILQRETETCFVDRIDKLEQIKSKRSTIEK